MLKKVRSCKMPAGLLQADGLPDCMLADKLLIVFLQTSDLKGVAVASFSLIFGFLGFCCSAYHPREMKQQDFILLEISRLIGTGWRRMGKGLSVLAWKFFTSHLNLPLKYIEPEKDVRVYSGSKPRKLVNLFCLDFFRKYAVNFIS